MFIQLRKKIAKIIAPEYIQEIEKLKDCVRGFDQKVNQRVAKVMSEMDPFEPLMREFHGVFSNEFEHPEDKLDARGQLLLKTWGYQQRDDTAFKHISEWIMNTQGNETLKRAPVTDKQILYGRAQISTMLLLVKEVGRLASLYEEELDKNKVQGFSSELSVE